MISHWSIAPMLRSLTSLKKAGFSYEEFPKVRAYMDAIRSRPAWQKTPKLPGL